MPDRLRRVAGAALGDGQQPLDRPAPRRQLRGLEQSHLRRRILLLPKQQQTQVGPSGRLLRHQRDHPIELLPRERFLAGLEGGERGVERRHGLAIRGLRDLGRRAAGGTAETATDAASAQQTARERSFVTNSPGYSTSADRGRPVRHRRPRDRATSSDTFQLVHRRRDNVNPRGRCACRHPLTPSRRRCASRRRGPPRESRCAPGAPRSRAGSRPTCGAPAIRSAASTGYQPRRRRRGARRCRTVRSPDRCGKSAAGGRGSPEASGIASTASTALHRRPEAAMGVEQKAGCQLRVPEATHRFAEAGGGEVQQGQPLEQRRIGHGRVERGDELFGRVELGLRVPLVVGEVRRAASRAPAPRAGAGCRAASAGSRSTAADR